MMGRGRAQQEEAGGSLSCVLGWAAFSFFQLTCHAPSPCHLAFQHGLPPPACASGKLCSLVVPLSLLSSCLSDTVASPRVSVRSTTLFL